jgi:hypothetical protein
MKNLQLLFLLFICAAFTFPAKDLRLEYAFKVGDEYTWTTKTHRLIKQNIPGMGEMSTEMDQSGVMSIKVAEILPTGAKLEVQYKQLKMNTKTPMNQGDVSMDSESTDESNQNKAVKAMMNKPFFVKLTKRGVVESVEGTENLFTDFGNLGSDDASLNVLKQQLQQTLNNETQKTIFSGAFITFPEKKIKTGETWTTSGEAKAMNFTSKVDQTMSLKSYDATHAVISIDGSVVSTDKDKAVELPMGIKAKLDITGKSVMSGKVSIKSGWSTELKGTAESKGTMTLLAGGMIPQDMLVPMEIVEQSEYIMVKK